MKNATVKNYRLTLLSLCAIFLFGSCVNEIESEDFTEMTPGTVPIKFTTKVNRNNTRVTNTAFEKGDKVGLYAILPSNSITEKRYIDNLKLEYEENNTFLPEKTVFYPAGGAALNFISYHPYLPAGIEAGKSTIPMSVQTDQSTAEALSLSDFMIASKDDVQSSENAVELIYHHKLTKIKLAITADTGEDIASIYKANPRIIAAGFKTKAEYDTKTNDFINLTEKADIIPYGEWNIVGGILTGKEFIVIPQETDASTQSFIMEWNGKIYTCPMPEMDMSGSTQCRIDIKAMQSTNHSLTGIAGTVEDWTPGENKETNNNGDITAVHLAALTFSQSNVYRVYHNGKPKAEICKEYLISDEITSRAIVAYPVKTDETSDLTKGVVLRLLDDERAINGGTISWNTSTNSFTYTQGTSQGIDKFHLNKDGEISVEETDTPIGIDIISHTIRDIRKGKANEYPIVKIGTQYWMREDLRATSYRDGTTLTKQTYLGKGAGYFNPRNTDTYFYNGEAVLAGDLAPAGYKIPNSDDWQTLKEYTLDNASILKAGEWEALDPENTISPNSNLTDFSALSVGGWGSSQHISDSKFVGYWTLNTPENSIPERTTAFIGENANFTDATTLIKDQTYYKGLSIRCLKE